VDISEWEQLALGHNCPLEAPRARSTSLWEYVVSLEASTLYLAKNQTYRGGSACSSSICATPRAQINCRLRNGPAFVPTYIGRKPRSCGLCGRIT
jgi:hypothetical protein